MGQDSILTYAEIVPTVDAGNAYAAGDLVFDATELTEVCPFARPSVVHSVQLLDEDDQGIAIDLYLLRSNTSQGTINNAYAPTDAQAREILARITIAAADYEDLTNSQQAYLSAPEGDAGMGQVVLPSASQNSLWMIGVTGGAPTYTASGLRIRVGFVAAG